jgi:predicted ATPase
MIKKISFSNYKIFKEEQELELKPLTILIGKNSSGKSSITKLMTLLEGSLNNNDGIPLSLENDSVVLGSEFRDLIYGREPLGTLNLKLETDTENILELSIAKGIQDLVPKIIIWTLNKITQLRYINRSNKYIYNANFYDYENNGFSINIKGETDIENYNLKNNGFNLKTNYIGPYRFIPERLIKLESQNIKNNKLGQDGKHAYSFLIQDIIYNDGLIFNKVSEWYKNNFEGWELDINYDRQPLYYELELAKNNPKLNINFQDVGQGMIQALPLVLSSFIPNETLNLINVFEQPELHLHPAAHGNLAERFAISTVELNKRYLIETHSQNFVLRLRRLVAEGKLNKDNLAIYYVNYNEENGESNLEQINVDEDGEVDFWPETVFNESLEEVLSIRKAQKRNRQ